MELIRYKYFSTQSIEYALALHLHRQSLVKETCFTFTDGTEPAGECYCTDDDCGPRRSGRSRSGLGPGAIVAIVVSLAFIIGTAVVCLYMRVKNNRQRMRTAASNGAATALTAFGAQPASAHSAQLSNIRSGAGPDNISYPRDATKRSTSPSSAPPPYGSAAQPLDPSPPPSYEAAIRSGGLFDDSAATPGTGFSKQ